jgi:hypothetical protein
MFRAMGLDERRVRHFMGALYKALILVTLGSLFAFAPLKGARRLATSEYRATIQEIPEVNGPNQILWLDSKRVARGQGESFRLAYEE